MNSNTDANGFPADNLYVLAQEALDRAIPEGELRTNNLTDTFYYELDQRIRRGEHININLNGTVRKGKSTAALALCNHIKGLIETHKHVNRPLTNQNVCRDQNEYSRLVKRRPADYTDDCDVIDEWAEMETASFNSTIEEKYLKQFSDVQAGRYYHRIACSPTNITDPNTDILLQVVAANKERKETLCLLSYRMTKGETAIPVLIGHVRIDVSDILDTPFYKEYLRKKAQKWELMNTHNVMSPRTLEYAIIMLNTYARIKDMFKLGLTQRKAPA